MEQTPLKVEQLIKLLLAMNPRAEVFLYGADGEYMALADEEVQEIYAPEKAAKTIVQFGGHGSAAASEGTP
ncbi:hypothetical protein D3C75_920720 [compost metagenome]